MLALITAALCAQLAFSAPQPARATRPNVLLLMADQMRWDTIGPDRTYGGPPLGNLSWLADTGAYFRHAYSTTPTCTPARSILLTGMSPWYNGMLGYGTIASSGYPFTWPRALSDAGWHTVAVGKNHFMWNSSSEAGYAHGFGETRLYDGLGNGMNTKGGEMDNYDRWFNATTGGENPLKTPGDNGVPLGWNTFRGGPYVYSEEMHPTYWTAENGASAIRNLTHAKEPWALKVSFHRPHSPYDPPARLLDEVLPEHLPPTRVCPDENGWDSIYANSSDCGPADPSAWCGLMPESEHILSRRAYLASLRFVDEGVGRVIAALNETGAMDNTFILFIADHGDGQGDHYLWRKGYPWEISAHVPMIARWPTNWPASVPRGTVVEKVTELRDIAPTIMDLAGLRVPAATPLNGSSLSCLLQTPNASGAGCGPASGPWRQWIDLEHDIVYNDTIHWSGATDGSTKYVFMALEGEEQLFDLTKDPYELMNIVEEATYAKILQGYRDKLVAQYTAEGRGSTWVQDGKLVPRPKGQDYSPNFPGGVPGAAASD